MPSRSRAQHNLMEAAAHDASFAKRANLPQRVAREFVAADKATGKGSKMAKNRSEHGMASEDGMSPRKAMASGKTHEGNFGVESYAEEHGGLGTHPDHAAHTGRKAHLEDHERGAPPAHHHTKHHHPAQAAPDHGPHHVDGYAHHHGEV